MKLSPLALSALLAPAALGCGAAYKPYVEPPAELPHAVVKVRRVHHATPGPQYAGSVTLNDQVVHFPIEPSAPATRGLRVRPQSAKWRFGSEFFHTVTRTETYTTTESYMCGSSPGAYGTSTPQYCTRSVQRTRTVTDHVTDAICAAVVSHSPSVGTTYLVQFDFEGTGKCTASCQEQKALEEEGGFKLEPCIGSRAGMEQ